jgi:aminoglycoside 2''-phosphotransferase
MEPQDVRARINTVFPEIEIVTVSRLGAGWDSEAWLINDELVFRFALRPGLDNQIRKERDLLIEISPYLGVRVPVPIYIARDGGKNALGFSGHEYIPGRPLSEVSLSQRDLERIADDIAAFLSTLHGLSTEDIEPLVSPITPETGQPWLHRDPFRIDIFPILDAEERVAVEDRWDKLTAGMGLPPRLVPIHADLDEEHLLVDESGRLVGIIDWGDATIGDPALDFAGLDTLLRRFVLARYKGVIDEGFGQRIQFYQWLRPFHWLNYGLYFGGGQAAVDRGLRDLMASIGMQ